MDIKPVRYQTEVLSRVKCTVWWCVQECSSSYFSVNPIQAGKGGGGEWGRNLQAATLNINNFF